ncbi:MAG: hypothetical protein LBU32_01075 [Clostridiales bacterium]|jgi:hypothetical protein|nr:hypothetical protein [Clostridiales bacterium]
METVVKSGSPLSNRLFRLPVDGYRVSANMLKDVSMATENSYVKVEGLPTDSVFRGNANPGNLFSIESDGHFKVECMSKETGYQKIAMEVTPKNGVFSADLSSGKLKLTGDAAVNVYCGEAFVDSSALDPNLKSYNVLVKIDLINGCQAKVILGDRVIYTTINGYAVFDHVLTGSYHAQIIYEQPNNQPSEIYECDLQVSDEHVDPVEEAILWNPRE